MNNYFSVLLVVLIGFSACQSEPEKKVVYEKPLSSKLESPKTAIESQAAAIEASTETNTSGAETPTEILNNKPTEANEETAVKKPRSTFKPTKPEKEEKLSAKLVTNSKTASGKKNEKTGPLPELVFDYKTHDFGIVNHGDTVAHKFYFVNEGDAPAIISEASSSCGCTVPDYPKKPIKPGQRAYIKAVFATKGKLNTQKKSITIKANTEPNYTTLYLTGEVYNRPKKKEPVDSTKLDSIKKAAKKAQKDSLKLKKKTNKKRNDAKEKPKKKKESPDKKVKDKLPEAKKNITKEKEEYFLPIPKPKKANEENKKEKP